MGDGCTAMVGEQRQAWVLDINLGDVFHSGGSQVKVVSCLF